MQTTVKFLRTVKLGTMGLVFYVLNNFKIICFFSTVRQNEKDTALVHNNMVRSAVLPYSEI